MTRTIVSDEQYGKLQRRVSDLVRRVDQGTIGYDHTMERIQAILEGRGYEGDLLHGMFASPDAQLRMAKQRNLERGWGFTDEDFASLGPAPSWLTDNRLVVVILDISLDSIEQTFEEAWDAVKGAHPANWRWPELKSDKESLRLLSGNHKRGLRWQVVDLGANKNARPIDVRNPKTSPSSALLWMAFYSPKWIQSMNGTDVPYVWIPGYEATISGYGAWTSMPLLFWDADDRKVELYADFSGYRNEKWAVPVLRESPK